MADKRTHFGRAGEYFAMSELLLRGWNVAVPVVDVGDDVFVIDDSDKTTWRLQVKSTEGEETTTRDGSGVRAYFNLSRAQLRAPQVIELFYMLVIRTGQRWRFLIVPRTDLLSMRDRYIEESRNRAGPGRRPRGDDSAKTDTLGFEVILTGDDGTGWGASLRPYLEQWPAELAPVTAGPGTVRRGVPLFADSREIPVGDRVAKDHSSKRPESLLAETCQQRNDLRSDGPVDVLMICLRLVGEEDACTRMHRGAKGGPETIQGARGESERLTIAVDAPEDDDGFGDGLDSHVPSMR